MFQPTEVKALPNHRLQIAYSDGVAGEIDLSDLAGRGVFTLWEQPGAFENVWITPYRAIAWSEEVELCADSLYLRLTEKAPEEVLLQGNEPVHT